MSEKINKILLKIKKEYVVINQFNPRDENTILDKLAKKIISENCMVEFNPTNLTDKNAVKLGKKLKQLCAEFNSLLIIKDRIDIALAINSNGVILDRNSIDISDAKNILGEHFIIGYSITESENIENILAQNIDFLKSQQNINVNIPIFDNYDAL